MNIRVRLLQIIDGGHRVIVDTTIPASNTPTLITLPHLLSIEAIHYAIEISTSRDMIGGL